MEGKVANGMRGTIHNIILDPRETIPEPEDDGTMKFKYPLALILLTGQRITNIVRFHQQQRTWSNQNFSWSSANNTIHGPLS